jgi:cytochrome c oxidase assembly protein Cox11
MLMNNRFSDRFGRDARVALVCLLVVAGMLGLVAVSLPLYRAFCEAVGLGGTTRRVAADTAAASARTVVVRFNSDVAPGLPWRFTPAQPSVTVHLGEQTLVSFWAENLTDQPIVGHATYNVAPDLAGRYFDKIQCFCFDEEKLGPHERVEMPVTFFVDPAILADPDMGGLPVITLSYTFFRSADPAKAKDLARFGATQVVAAAAHAGDPRQGEAIFGARCAACHALDANRVGPALGGLAGRRAGSVDGFRYSNALKSASIVWNPASLDRWLADPRDDVPGVRMPVNVPDPQARADVIAYLLQSGSADSLR